ncbi:MAG: diguanylate cyclase [Pseudomonadota bacterium]
MEQQEQTELYIEPEAISPQNIEETVRQYVYRLRLKFLLPAVLMLILAVILLISIVYLHESRTIDRDLIQLQSTASNLYKYSIKKNTKVLQGIMDDLSSHQEIASALSTQDRSRLLQHSASIYEKLNHHYGVTHFYFSNHERVNILRVHKPDKYGDTINRQTTLLAEQDGAAHYGVEIGPLGTLTLRYVKPWFEEQTHNLIGFVELGIEVENSVDAIRDLLGLDVFTIVNKRFLEKNSWEEGSQTFNYETDWDRFPHIVLDMGSNQLLPPAISTLMQEIDLNAPAPLVVYPLEVNNQYAIFISIDDVFGRPVGCLVMIKDTNGSYNQAHKTILIGSGLLLIAAIFAVVFFYWLVGRVADRMARNEISLHQLATHDHLTGLLNRRQFELKLDNSITQFTRYGRTVSLLMIDIDYFKHINDKYGHSAGDAVLVEFGKRLTKQARTIDSVYRYGGEEFSILLPETDSQSATLFAQRLCEIVGKEQYSLDEEIEITVTVSIGIASCPLHANTAKALVQAADDSLYEAKKAGRNCIYSYSGSNENN